jgi:hypothetical protein
VSTKKCANCKKQLPIAEFEVLNRKWKRSICRKCRTTEQNKNRSASAESYLSHLCTQLKYARNKKNPEMEWAIDPGDLATIWHRQNGRCAISGIHMTHVKDGTGVHDFNVSIDRINPHLHYLPDNIQLVCHRVNIMKHNLPEDSFFWWVKNIVTTNEIF